MIATKIKQLKKLAPKKSKHGQLYRLKGDTQGAWNKVRLWTLFVSDLGRFTFRPHIFVKDTKRTAEQWDAWFKKHLDKIMRNAVLPGIATRNGGEFYAVWKYAGWTREDAIYNTRAAAPHKRRHKTKPQRREDD